MGRTLVVQAFLFVAICCGFPPPGLPQAQAAEVVVLPTSVDPVEELITWLDQLCFVVHCTADRPAGDESANKSDWIAVQFILSYETYGVRDDLSLIERDYAYFASQRATQVLIDNPGRLDSQIEAALSLALRAVRSDLKK